MLIIYVFTDDIFLISMVVLLILLLIFIYFLKHRDITHTLLMGILLSLPILYIGKLLFILTLSAYTSHLILDRELKFI